VAVDCLALLRVCTALTVLSVSTGDLEKSLVGGRVGSEVSESGVTLNSSNKATLSASVAKRKALSVCRVCPRKLSENRLLRRAFCSELKTFD
jgi:hypothetical protein